MTEDEQKAAETENSFRIMAIKADRVSVTTCPNGVRIAFGEQQPSGATLFHAAEFLSFDDGRALRALLALLLDDSGGSA